MLVAEALDSCSSASWPPQSPSVAVVVSTHNRGHLLEGLFRCLEVQTEKSFEVVVADNGSTDDTWDRLASICAATALPMLAIRLQAHAGPGVPRNTAISRTRGPIIAITDDDCLPEPSWLAEMVAGFQRSAIDLLQGRTLPEPDAWAGPWGRTVEIKSFSGLYETCNLAVRRSAFDSANGFSGPQWLTGRAFGEDVAFGSLVSAQGRAEFAEGAVVRHRIMPGSYRDHLNERVRLRGFPPLVRSMPELRSRLAAGVFLKQRTAVTDVGFFGLACVAATKHPLPAALALPWAAALWRESVQHPGRARPVRAAQLAVADLIGFGALAVGSVRSRRVVL